MRLRVILIIVAIIIAGVAVFGVIAYISNIKQTAEKEVEKIEVLVAVQNIPKDTFVDDLVLSKSVELQAIPRKYIADGVLTTLDDFKGFVTMAPISKGEQITSTKFVKPEQVGLAFNIPGDMVAISIPVDEVIGVSNLISIGDMVNVIATFKPEEKQAETATTTAATVETATVETQAVEAGEEEILTEIKEPITKTLLWNVKVLYLGTREITVEEQKAKDSKILSNQAAKEENAIIINTVTLAVSPEDAEKLVFSEEMGLVWLALVPSEGVEVKETPGRTYKNIFEEQ
jgi:pilus assembly protein CpaB